MLALNKIKPNMTELHFSGGVVLFSYNTPVAYRSLLGKEYKTKTNWSKTTSRHINYWLMQSDNAEKAPQEFFDNIVNAFDMDRI